MSESFLSNLPLGLIVDTPVERRLLIEYGALFVAQNVTVPQKVVFRDEADVSEFQSRLLISVETLGEILIELQASAMDALLDAIAEAEKQGLYITPRGSDSARRTYGDTVQLWSSRVEPALDHWVTQGRLSGADANRIRSMAPFEQVPEILKLEEEGIFFAKDFSKSIIYSVAPPGTSQHLSLLAFDVTEFADPRICDILTQNNWYQTVLSDLPHFTYLGIDESSLSSHGLKNVISDGRSFWVPNI